MNKKSKKRWKEFIKLARYSNEHIPRLIVPNETRVSGGYMMFQSAVRAKCVLIFMHSRSEWAEQYKKLMLSADEWNLVAEFESVMKYTHELAMKCQTNHPGEMAYGWLNVCGVREKLKDDLGDHFKVVDVNGKPYPAFRPRNQLIMTAKRRSELHKSTQEFLDRLVVNMGIYFPKADDDQLIGMNLHLLFHWSGFK